jgi:hypothetical protein
MKIIIKNKEIKASAFETPILVSGECGSGASYFSVVLISRLVNLGEKVIYFCRSRQGVELLINLTNLSQDSTQVLIVEPGDRDSFKHILENTSDLGSRIVFVKNIEQLFDKDNFEIIKKAKGYVLSGDSDLCPAIDSAHLFKSKVFFSDSKKFNFQMPRTIQKYEGFAVSTKINGQVMINKHQQITTNVETRKEK